jgi:hypothetical protein
MTMRNFQKYLPLLAALAFLLPRTGFAQDSAKTPATAAASQTAPSGAGDSVDKTVAKFFGLLMKGQIDDAYGYLTNGTKIADDLEEMAKLKVNTKVAIEKFGQIKGYELVGIQTTGTHLMRATYLSLGTGYPLRWKFYFYRLDNGWQLIDLGVDDRLVDMFEDNKPQQAEQQQPGSGQ